MFYPNLKLKVTGLLFYFLLLSGTGYGQQPATASDESDLIKVETHAVFFNSMVRDKHSRQPVPDLHREDFRLFIDGKERPIDYFGFDGQERRPLKLILYFNLAPEGALRYLSQSAATLSLKATLSKLGAQDEVMVVTARDWFVGKPEILTELTRDWDQVVASIVQAATDSTTAPKVDKTQKHTMSEAVSLAVTVAESHRSHSEVALIYISDGINTLDTMNFGSRKAIAGHLLEDNISFSAINFAMLRAYSAAAIVINPLAFAFGASVTGSAGYLAEQSGGIKTDVKAPELFGTALEQVITAYSGRYGFGIDLDRKDLDGRVHKIELKMNQAHRRKSQDLIINVKRRFYAAQCK